MATMSAQVVVESGRVVIVPVLRLDSSPMGAFCLQLSVPKAGKMWVGLQAEAHPGKIKKRRVTSVRICPDKAHLEQYELIAKVSIVSPFLFVGDATFMYVERRKSGEYERAVQAARSESRMGGSFRTDDGQIAACVRLGDKERVMLAELRGPGEAPIITLGA